MYRSAERPVQGPIYSDEYIEFWGSIYLANPQVRARGVRFDTFLVVPIEVLRACGGVRISISQATGAVSLRYPVAEAAIRRLEHTGARCENGRFVEKLRHHAHPRSNHRDFQPGTQ